MVVEDGDRLIAGREYASDQNIDLDIEARCRVLHEGGEGGHERPADMEVDPKPQHVALSLRLRA